MSQVPDERVVEGIGHKFVEYMAEMEGLKPDSEATFLYKHFRLLLAGGVGELGFTSERMRDAYVQVLLNNDKYALDSLLRAIADRVLLDPSLRQSWRPSGRSAHAPPFGQTRKPGSHEAPC